MPSHFRSGHESKFFIQLWSKSLVKIVNLSYFKYQFARFHVIYPIAMEMLHPYHPAGKWKVEKSSVKLQRDP